MNRLKFMLVVLLVPLSSMLHAQCTQAPLSDSLYNADHPWVGDNKYLIKYLKKHGYDVPEDYFDNLDAKGKYKGKKVKLKDYKKDKKKDSGGRMVAGLQEVYIPVRVVVHQGPTGNMPDNYSIANLEAALTNVNNVFFENDVPIVLYRAQAISFINDSPHFNCVNDGAAELAQDIDLALMYSRSDMLNIHVVNEIDGAGGSALIGIPSMGLIIPANNLRPPVFFPNRDRTTLAHELGHALGLLHTNQGSGLFCGSNENCNKCEQESVNRYRTNALICAQLGKKCEVNGDKLCDTAAEPDLRDLVNDNNCNYFGTGRDNWGDSWQVPEINVMSRGAIGDGCRDFLSLGQAANMHWHATNTYTVKSGVINFSVNLAESAAGELTGSTTLCSGISRTFTLSNPNGVTGATTYTYVLTDLEHNAINAVTFTSAGANGVTVTSNGTFTGPAYLRVDMRNAGGYITSLHRKVHLGTPQFVGWDIDGPSVMNVGTSAVFTAPEIAGANSYQWQVSSGLSMPSGSSSSRVSVTANSIGNYKQVQVRGVGTCGATPYRSTFVEVVSSGAGCLTMEANIFPNPVKKGQRISYKIAPPPDEPCLTASMEDGEIEVIDLLGRKHVSHKLTESTGTIEISDVLQAGIYFLNFKQNGQYVQSRRLVIHD